MQCINFFILSPRLLNEGDFDVEFSACSMGMILTYNNNLTKKFEETLTLRAQADDRWQKVNYKL